MSVELDQLLITKATKVGYRSTCGTKDSTVDTFKAFEKEIAKLEKQGMVISKIQLKMDNKYATSHGGFWEEFEFKIIDSELITPNVALIIKEKYRIIKGTVPRQVRSELNKAVKNGVLGHIAKTEHGGECYFFINHQRLAENKVTQQIIENIKSLATVLI